jgi:hypothetical protein
MKRLSFLMVMGLVLGMLAFTFIKNGGIQGKVSPADGAAQVLAVSGTDTLKTEINNGSFTFSAVKPGTYTVWVKAKAPYKDTSVENVAVVDSATTDVGEIKLQQ